MKATIYKIGKPRKDGSSLLYLAFEGKRSLWEHGPVGSFWYAKCPDQSLPVRDAQACIFAIETYLTDNRIIALGAENTQFSWHHNAILANWNRA